MKKQLKKCTALLAAALFLFAGCGNKEQDSSKQSETTLQSSQPSQSASGTGASKSGEAGVTYPLDTDAKLTWWTTLSVNVSASVKSLNETRFAKALAEQTGVAIEFIHPAQGQEQEQFNLLIASGKMADIVEYTWLTQYLGGADAAIQNNLIYKLNDVLESWAPDYYKELQSDPQIDRLLKTDSGNYFGFGMFMRDPILLSSSGPLVRADWLEELGLSVPETLDDWEAMLRAFKEKKGATAPLVGDSNGLGFFWQNAIIGAYGIQKDFYVDDGKIKYGPLEPGYKEWLIRMAAWYKEGLINPNFVTDTRKEKEANLLNGMAGAAFGYAQSTMGAMTAAIQEIDPNAEFEAVPYPVMNKGERPKMGQKNFVVSHSNPVTIVNPKSANVEVAVKVLNYGYTKEGYALYNFGVEGESFTWKEQFPQMNREILNPPAGKTVAQEWSLFARSPYNGPFEQSGDFMTQYMTKPYLKDALGIWSATDAEQYNLPPISITVDESREYNQIRSDLDSYMNEWVCQAISGIVPIEEFDSVFVPTLMEIGAEDAVKTLQAAYERFVAR